MCEGTGRNLAPPTFGTFLCPRFPDFDPIQPRDNLLDTLDTLPRVLR